MASASSPSSSPPRVLSIPAQVSLPRVGLKKSILERRHADFTCEINQAARQVSLSGSEAQLMDALGVFEQLFGQLAVVSSPSPAPVRRGVQVSPQQCYRSFAALGADSSLYWRFIPTRSQVSDVDTQKFPYELVRVPGNHRSPASASTRTIGYEPPRQRLGDTRAACRFLMNFDDQYIAREAEAIDNVVIENQQRDALKLKAVFGRKLFSFKSVEPETVYSVDTLRGHSLSYHRCNSNWSNICDSDGPELKRLVSKLHTAKSKLGITDCKEEMAIWLELGCDKLKVTFARGGVESIWEYQSTKRSAGAHFVHDISLADRVNFRVKVYNQSELLSAEDPKVEEIRAMLVVHEPEAADDIFSSKVELVEGVRASMLWRTIKRTVKVPLGGLLFKMLHLGDELQLEAQLLSEASEDMPTDAARMGDKFKFLVEKLHAIVMEDSGTAAADGADSSEGCP
ncbi:hypothetical protein Gpo141_00004591 [Globisporangium polare]